MKIGIITYHSAYNFGSMLQAFATQEAVKKMGHEAIILNYRMQSQKNFYAEYRTKYGKLNFLQDLCQLPMHNAKIERKQNYEKFFDEHFNLTAEFSEPEVMKEICKDFDVIISGSDQIWNSRSCEFVNCDIEYMKPYLLDGFQGKKISYASSIGHITDKELEYIIPYVKKFDFLSVREQSTKDRISKYIGKSIERVLDPTFLLTGDEWIEHLNLRKEENRPYILFYSLKRFDGNNILKEVIELAHKKNMAVKYIMPFSYLPNIYKDVRNCEDFGPVEFMNAIYNSEMVITDSYHGTILSINLNKNVYSLCSSGGAEFRKTEVLKRLGLENRVVHNVSDILDADYEIKYENVNELLIKERIESMRYLNEAILS